MRVALRIAIDHAIRLLSRLQAGVHVVLRARSRSRMLCSGDVVAASVQVCQLSGLQRQLHVCQQHVPRSICILHGDSSSYSYFYCKCRLHRYRPAICGMNVDAIAIAIGRRSACYRGRITCVWRIRLPAPRGPRLGPEAGERRGSVSDANSPNARLSMVTSLFAQVSPLHAAELLTVSGVGG